MYKYRRTMMNQQQTQPEVAYETMILERLREFYLTRTLLPTNEGTPLTISDFYRFYRYIKAEGYQQ
jgi:hypothetical protein